ncbi:hypothetical protein BGZ94_008162 [Podila epigama]|nr:hypothetical protein BGZ94_008162 [Podila epigama]
MATTRAKQDAPLKEYESDIENSQTQDETSDSNEEFASASEGDDDLPWEPVVIRSPSISRASPVISSPSIPVSMSIPKQTIPSPTQQRQQQQQQSPHSREQTHTYQSTTHIHQQVYHQNVYHHQQHQTSHGTFSYSSSSSSSFGGQPSHELSHDSSQTLHHHQPRHQQQQLSYSSSSSSLHSQSSPSQTISRGTPKLRERMRQSPVPYSRIVQAYLDPAAATVHHNQSPENVRQAWLQEQQEPRQESSEDDDDDDEQSQESTTIDRFQNPTVSNRGNSVAHPPPTQHTIVHQVITQSGPPPPSALPTTVPQVTTRASSSAHGTFTGLKVEGDDNVQESGWGFDEEDIQELLPEHTQEGHDSATVAATLEAQPSQEPVNRNRNDKYSTSVSIDFGDQVNADETEASWGFDDDISIPANDNTLPTAAQDVVVAEAAENYTPIHSIHEVGADVDDGWGYHDQGIEIAESAIQSELLENAKEKSAPVASIHTWDEPTDQSALADHEGQETEDAWDHDSQEVNNVGSSASVSNHAQGTKDTSAMVSTTLEAPNDEGDLEEADGWDDDSQGIELEIHSDIAVSMTNVEPVEHVHENNTWGHETTDAADTQLTDDLHLNAKLDSALPMSHSLQPLEGTEQSSIPAEATVDEDAWGLDTDVVVETLVDDHIDRIHPVHQDESRVSQPLTVYSEPTEKDSNVSQLAKNESKSHDGFKDHTSMEPGNDQLDLTLEVNMDDDAWGYDDPVVEVHSHIIESIQDPIESSQSARADLVEPVESNLTAGSDLAPESDLAAQILEHEPVIDEVSEPSESAHPAEVSYPGDSSFGMEEESEYKDHPNSSSDDEHDHEVSQVLLAAQNNTFIDIEGNMEPSEGPVLMPTTFNTHHSRSASQSVSTEHLTQTETVTESGLAAGTTLEKMEQAFYEHKDRVASESDSGSDIYRELSTAHTGKNASSNRLNEILDDDDYLEHMERGVPMNRSISTPYSDDEVPSRFIVEDELVELMERGEPRPLEGQAVSYAMHDMEELDNYEEPVGQGIDISNLVASFGTAMELSEQEVDPTPEVTMTSASTVNLGQALPALSTFEQVPAEHVPVEHVLPEQVPVDKKPVEQAPVEQVPVEHVPVEHVPVEHVLPEQVPVEQKPIEHVPVEQKPVEHVPVKQASAEQVLAEKSPEVTREESLVLEVVEVEASEPKKHEIGRLVPIETQSAEQSKTVFADGSVSETYAHDTLEDATNADHQVVSGVHEVSADLNQSFEGPNALHDLDLAIAEDDAWMEQDVDILAETVSVDAKPEVAPVDSWKAVTEAPIDSSPAIVDASAESSPVSDDASVDSPPVTKDAPVATQDEHENDFKDNTSNMDSAVTDQAIHIPVESIVPSSASIKIGSIIHNPTLEQAIDDAVEDAWGWDEQSVAANLEYERDTPPSIKVEDESQVESSVSVETNPSGNKPSFDPIEALFEKSAEEIHEDYPSSMTSATLDAPPVDTAMTSSSSKAFDVDDFLKDLERPALTTSTSTVQPETVQEDQDFFKDLEGPVVTLSGTTEQTRDMDELFGDQTCVSAYDVAEPQESENDNVAAVPPENIVKQPSSPLKSLALEDELDDNEDDGGAWDDDSAWPEFVKEDTLVSRGADVQDTVDSSLAHAALGLDDDHVHGDTLSWYDHKDAPKEHAEVLVEPSDREQGTSFVETNATVAKETIESQDLPLPVHEDPAPAPMSGTGLLARVDNPIDKDEDVEDVEDAWDEKLDFESPLPNHDDRITSPLPATVAEDQLLASKSSSLNVVDEAVIEQGQGWDFDEDLSEIPVPTFVEIKDADINLPREASPATLTMSPHDRLFSNDILHMATAPADRHGSLLESSPSPGAKTTFEPAALDKPVSFEDHAEEAKDAWDDGLDLTQEPAHDLGVVIKDKIESSKEEVKELEMTEDSEETEDAWGDQGIDLKVVTEQHPETHDPLSDQDHGKDHSQSQDQRQDSHKAHMQKLETELDAWDIDTSLVDAMHKASLDQKQDENLHKRDNVDDEHVEQVEEDSWDNDDTGLAELAKELEKEAAVPQQHGHQANTADTQDAVPAQDIHNEVETLHATMTDVVDMDALDNGWGFDMDDLQDPVAVPEAGPHKSELKQPATETPALPEDSDNTAKNPIQTPRREHEHVVTADHSEEEDGSSQSPWQDVSPSSVSKRSDAGMSLGSEFESEYSIPSMEDDDRTSPALSHVHERSHESSLSAADHSDERMRTTMSWTDLNEDEWQDDSADITQELQQNVAKQHVSIANIISNITDSTTGHASGNNTTDNVKNLITDRSKEDAARAGSVELPDLSGADSWDFDQEDMDTESFTSKPLSSTSSKVDLSRDVKTPDMSDQRNTGSGFAEHRSSFSSIHTVSPSRTFSSYQSSLVGSVPQSPVNQRPGASMSMTPPASSTLAASTSVVSEGSNSATTNTTTSTVEDDSHLPLAIRQQRARLAARGKPLPPVSSYKSTKGPKPNNPAEKPAPEISPPRLSSTIGSPVVSLTSPVLANTNVAGSTSSTTTSVPTSPNMDQKYLSPALLKQRERLEKKRAAAAATSAGALSGARRLTIGEQSGAAVPPKPLSPLLAKATTPLTPNQSTSLTGHLSGNVSTSNVVSPVSSSGTPHLSSRLLASNPSQAEEERHDQAFSPASPLLSFHNGENTVRSSSTHRLSHTSMSTTTSPVNRKSFSSMTSPIPTSPLADGFVRRSRDGKALATTTTTTTTTSSSSLGVDVQETNVVKASQSEVLLRHGSRSSVLMKTPQLSSPSSASSGWDNTTKDEEVEDSSFMTHEKPKSMSSFFKSGESASKVSSSESDVHKTVVSASGSSFYQQSVPGLDGDDKDKEWNTIDKKDKPTASLDAFGTKDDAEDPYGPAVARTRKAKTSFDGDEERLDEGTLIKKSTPQSSLSLTSPTGSSSMSHRHDHHHHFNSVNSNSLLGDISSILEEKKKYGGHGYSRDSSSNKNNISNNGDVDDDWKKKSASSSSNNIGDRSNNNDNDNKKNISAGTSSNLPKSSSWSFGSWVSSAVAAATESIDKAYETLDPEYSRMKSCGGVSAASESGGLEDHYGKKPGYVVGGSSLALGLASISRAGTNNDSASGPGVTTTKAMSSTSFSHSSDSESPVDTFKRQEHSDLESRDYALAGSGSDAHAQHLTHSHSRHQNYQQAGSSSQQASSRLTRKNVNDSR